MKKIVLFLIGILFMVSCNKPAPESSESSGLGGVEGYLCFKILTLPLSGYDIKIAGKTATTDATGYFAIYKIPEGRQTLEVWLGAKLVYKADMNILSDVNIPISVPLLYKKGDLPDEIVVIDISSYFSPWNFMVRGKDKLGNEECLFIDEENFLTKKVSFYQFAKDEYFEVEFYDNGLPKRVKTGEYVFMFGNFNGNEFDFGVLYPSGEVQIIKDIKTDFVWQTPSKGTMSRSDVIRWTGRILGAMPCVISGTAAFLTGGAAVPLALWTCGNYLLSMANNFFDDAGIENDFTQFVDDYHLIGTNYTCVTTLDLTSCLLSFAHAGLEAYADYIEEMDIRHGDLLRLEQLMANNVPLKKIVLQPGPEGKDAWISMGSYDNCIEFYDRSSNDSLISVIYDAYLGTCSKQVERMLLQFSIGAIPLTAAISSATLEIYGNASINIKNEIPTLTVSRLNGSWTEAGVTWLNCPESEAIGNIDFVNKSINSRYSLDITFILQDWVSGRKDNYGFLISTTERTVYSKVCSGDHPNSDLRPRITVYYR